MVSVSLFSFQGISLVLLVGSSSSTFSSYLTFIGSVNLGVRAVYCGPEDFFFFFFNVEASLHRLCMSSVFGIRDAFGMDARHVFPLSMLDLITLMGSIIGVIESRACAGC